jgi:Na+-transporting NADH:ubiquinone oxidoreductase subunit B
MLPIDIEQRTSAINFKVLSWFILATLPALSLGLWSVGQHTQEMSEGLSANAGGVTIFNSLLLGASYFIPRLLIAALVSFGWAMLFARMRGRKVDPGWFYAAWLFVLLMPAAAPLPLIGIGLSFGLVFGNHIFGGTGRYIVNPALLGVVFLTFSYPGLMDEHWLPGIGVQSTWSVAAAQGTDALAATGIGWLDVAMGREVAALGVPAAGACLAGVIILILTGLASWRVVVGGLFGVMVVAAAFDSPAFYWQPVLGSFAFALAFVATDPTTTPLTRAGRWTFGIAFGTLTIVIRMLNPEHPEGTLFALLLAYLLVPLVDHLATPAKTARSES